ncbi:MFS transporter [Pseudofrankia inefficax]|uniref:Major facilitator superfamily MFS_1 n=1 Tax=Pseudofrankia inefficax (strain DSM 45817 / CECT 9037 / DDB 130130 / EuI1c) TaxID=298654 RepID=E3IU12_PSEI1|nr:MFS transporter [Pseudofrankia inefficax]ADP81205.1 major facilitator superfamily MFS_1 [Pseudofrankia inefficax]
MAVATAVDSRTERQSPLVFLTVVYVLTVLLIGPNIPTPLYPIYRHDFRFSALTITLIYATYAGSLIPSLVLFGPLSDAVGRRRVLLTSMAFAAAGAVLLASAQGTGWLFAGRILQGVGIGAGTGAASAALREAEPHDNQSRAAIASTAAMVGGSAIGPLLAGVLVQYAPGPRVLSYVVYLVLLAVGVLGAWRWSETVPEGSWTPRRPRIPAEMRGRFATAGATAFLVWAVTALFLALIPSFMASEVHTSNAALAGMVVTLMLGTSAFVQLSGRGLATLHAEIAGLLITVLGLIALNVAGSVGSIVPLLIAAVAAGAGQGLAFLGAAKDVNLHAPPARLGEVMSSFYVVVYAGVGIPIIAVGLLARSIDLFTAVRYFSVVVGVGCLLVALALRVRAPGRASGAAVSS